MGLLITLPMAVADKAILSPPSGTLSFVASTRDTLFLWGGRGDAEPETVYTYSVNTETWMRELTKGPHPPAGLREGGCTLAGQCIYLYGGSYASSSYFGSLYELNTDDFTWSKLSNDGGPPRKTACKMITYKDQVLVVGGYYNPYEVFSKQPGSRYEGGFTNELHSYSLSAGKFKHVVTKVHLNRCEALLCSNKSTKYCRCCLLSITVYVFILQHLTVSMCLTGILILVVGGAQHLRRETLYAQQCHLWNTMKDVVRGSRIGLYINVKGSGVWNVDFMDFWNI